MSVKRFITIILALVAFAAAAEEVVIDTLPRRMGWATARMRVRAPRRGSADWTATLGDTATNYMRVRVAMPAREEIYGRRAVAVAAVGGRAGEREVGRAEFDCSADEASLRIVYDGYSARVYAGDAANVLVCRLDSLCAGPLTADIPAGASLAEAWARFLPIPEPEMAPFATVDDLLARIAASADPYEGLWRYLDRDMDPVLATLDARYTLATVRRPDGTYDIIYLSSDAALPGWRPLQIKGRLAPTIFIGNFDLRWLDAVGILVGEEANAQFAPDGAILALRFPLLRAQLRFSRVAPASFPR